MESLLFVPAVSASEWLHELLPELSPVALPIAGRHFLDYALESAQRFGFVRTGVLDWRYSEQFSKNLSEGGSNRGIPCLYQKMQGLAPHGLNELEKTPSPFTNPVQDGLFVVWGICLTSHDPNETTYDPVPDEECAETPAGIYCRRDGRWMRIRPRGIVARDIKSWYRMNSAVLENAWLFTLPGYSAEENIYLGRNVVLERGTKVKPPVILQDNTWCARNVSLGGDVVVGQGSFIGEGAHLARTIIGDNTYVGVGLEIEDKIVVGRRIIDISTGSWTDIEEPGLAETIGEGGFAWLHKLWAFLEGTSHGRRR